MKKWIALLMALLMLGLTACGSETSLYAHGLDVVQMLSEMAQSEECIGLYTADAAIGSLVQEIGEQDHWAPKAVYAISVTDENLSAMAELDGMELSDELKAYLKQRTLSTLVPQINAQSGVEALAAASICTAGKTFVSKDAESDVIYIYAYENAVPTAVTFTVGEDGAVSASGVFIMNENFTCGSAEEIENFFSDISVEVTEVSQK